jgi:hypothetical protein
VQVKLGTNSAQEAYRLPDDPTVYYRPVPGDRATTVSFNGEESLVEAFQAVCAASGHWNNHNVAGSVPTWVWSDTPGLAEVIASNFGGIPVVAEAPDESALLAALPEPEPLPSAPVAEHTVTPPAPEVVQIEELA